MCAERARANFSLIAMVAVIYDSMFEAHAVGVGSNEGATALLPLFKSNYVGHL